MTHTIRHWLNEATLGFLALLSLFLMAVPAVFHLGAQAEAWVALIEYGIVGLFALEYALALRQAEEKHAFVRNRWRLLDALIIVAALVSLLPVASDLLRSSPILRLLRLGRLALLGTRSTLALRLREPAAIAPGGDGKGELSALALADSGAAFENMSWDAVAQRFTNAEADWLFIDGVSPAHLPSIATLIGVSEQILKGLFQSSLPRFDRLEQVTTLFFRYPREMLPGQRLRRMSVLLVGRAENIVVLSGERTDLAQRLQQRLISLDAAMPRMIRATVALLGEINRAYTGVVDQLENTLLQIESEQVQLDDHAFLARTFELRADILRVRSSLKHLRGVMRDLQRGHLALASADSEQRALYGLLADDCGDLYDDIEELRESLQSLVDLRLNVASFQMNRVMRLLALLTALALIPATAGGLLGMNLIDTPWPATLTQVAFGVAAGMALSFYVFAIKGWMR